jgi:hypothetical protein
MVISFEFKVLDTWFNTAAESSKDHQQSRRNRIILQDKVLAKIKSSEFLSLGEIWH